VDGPTGWGPPAGRLRARGRHRQRSGVPRLGFGPAFRTARSKQLLGQQTLGEVPRKLPVLASACGRDRRKRRSAERHRRIEWQVQGVAVGPL